jgi:sugar phosphate isomerase/epimerase
MQSGARRRLHAGEGPRDLAGVAGDDDLLGRVEQQRAAMVATVLEQHIRAANRLGARLANGGSG